MNAEFIKQKAKEYGAITRVFLRNDNCPTMLIWGISDNHSWRQNQPLLYNSSLKPKPAYYNVHAQLRIAANKLTSVESIEMQDNLTGVKEVKYFNMNGQPTVQPKGLTIIRTIYNDGTVKTRKALF